MLGTEFRRTKSERVTHTTSVLGAFPSHSETKQMSAGIEWEGDARRVTYVSRLHILGRVNVNGSVNDPRGEGLDGY